ncbi:MAG: hypothetical protein OEY57_11715 [Nitrospirota bacterium]|nr:hypothetical protein [Nitrospirota bacterium]
MIFHKVLLTFLIGFQIVGPSWFGVLFLSEAKAQESPASQARIAGLRGVVTVQPDRPDQPGYSPKYRDSLSAGDVITTEEESVAELLLDHQGLITLQEYSEAMLGKKPDGSFSVDLHVGAAEWSLPQQGTGQAALSFSTPNIRGKTTGGLITAAVQSTLSETAEELRPKRSFVVRTSLRAQSPQAGKVALLETFCVKEGTLEVDFPGTQSGAREQKEVPVGQCVGFFNGVLRAMGDEYQIADWRTICAVGQHCEIPEAAKKLIKKKQMAQALALERALVGSDTKDGDVDEQVILATTGSGFGTSTQQSETGGSVLNPPILPCTGNSQLCAAPDPNVGGPPPSTGGGSGGNTSPGNIQTIGALVPASGVAGGLGVLTFLDSNFTAEKELVLADSGIKVSAPHAGKAPQNTLVISSLAPNGAGAASNQHVPLQFSSFNQATTPTVQIGTESADRFEQAEQLAQFARSSAIDPGDIFASVPEAGAAEPCQTLLDCFEIILAQGRQGTFLSSDADAGIDGTVQVRSSSTFDPGLGLPGATREVTLKGGVVLVNSHVLMGSQSLTSTAFSTAGALLGTTIHGAAVSVVGAPGDPALLTLEDRALAVLEGSSLMPVSSTVSTALIAVLDSQLIGPTIPPVIGKDVMGNDVVRPDVSPLIEVIDGSIQTDIGVFVGSTAANQNSVVLDQALLEASSPLLAMIRGSLTTSGDFGRVAGQNAKLMASLVAGDALIRLDASSIVVNGNFFNVTGGAQVNVANGSLVSLTGGSTFTLNGVFVNVGLGSVFTLTNGALVDFGTGINTVNVANSLCAAGGCFSPFSNSTWQVAGSPASFSAPAGYNPFVDLGTFQDGSVNTVNVTPGSAILSIQPGGNINIQN